MPYGKRIPCLFMRGGTSRGAFFRDRDLPTDRRLRDRVILAVYGSPDSRQIDGLGGADALTSKVALVDRCDSADADVTYTFGQVSIATAEVFWVGNCGNMLAAVAPFAIHTGLVPAVAPVTRVRIFNANTKKVITAEVYVDAETGVVEEGDLRVAGVPGSGAPIALDFGDCGGSVCGSVLPTGAARDELTLDDGSTVSVSIVDAAAPFVFVRARDVGMSGVEMPPDIAANATLCDRLEMIRGAAARLSGIVGAGEDATRVSPSIPRVSVVSPPCGYRTSDGEELSTAEVDLVARQMSMQRPHKTYAVTGTVCTAVARQLAGSVVHEVAAGARAGGRVAIGHPGGLVTAEVATAHSPDIAVERASVLRTARVIMDGYAHVPQRVLDEGLATEIDEGVDTELDTELDTERATIGGP